MQIIFTPIDQGLHCLYEVYNYVYLMLLMYKYTIICIYKNMGLE